MDSFPVDAPLRRVLCALARLGFRVVREGNHIALSRENADQSQTSLTLPNHPRLKSSTLRTILTLASISRRDFLEAYESC